METHNLYVHGGQYAVPGFTPVVMYAPNYGARELLERHDAAAAHLEAARRARLQCMQDLHPSSSQSPAGRIDSELGGALLSNPQSHGNCQCHPPLSLTPTFQGGDL